MRILITNDDGINAPGLAVLREIAEDIAGPEGEVWCVAPAFEQSGVGHTISYSHPFTISKFSDRVFAVEGSPADCVLAAVHDVMTDAPPDLVLSGVNRGNNAAENVLYSGTIGAAMEAALQELPAIALSQFLGPENWNAEDMFECARVHGAETVRRILGFEDRPGALYRLFYNVNFPPVPAAQVAGTSVALQGKRPATGFAVEPQTAPNGRRYLWIRGGNQQAKTAPGSDAQLNLEGHITVTPMRADLTAHSVIADLESHLG